MEHTKSQVKVFFLPFIFPYVYDRSLLFVSSQATSVEEEEEQEQEGEEQQEQRGWKHNRLPGTFIMDLHTTGISYEKI